VCPECFRGVENEGCWEGVIGQPQVSSGPNKLRFEHQSFALPDLARVQVLDIQPVWAAPEEWVAVTSEGTLVRIDLRRRSIVAQARLPDGVLNLPEKVTLRVTRRGD